MESNNTESLPDESSYQPLRGASVFILLIDSTNSESEVAADHTVEALGGKRTYIISEATHTLLIRRAYYHPDSGLDDLCGEAVLETLRTSRHHNVPVVDASWLERIAGLSPNQHWSEINVDSHVPSIVNHMEAERISMQQIRLSHFAPSSSSSPAAAPQRQEVSSCLSSGRDRTRRDTMSDLGASISETNASMTRENPDLVEENQVRRAIELSMLDWALVFRKQKKKERDESLSSHRILGVKEDASPNDIRAAYRRRAFETHPDKGGKPGEFEAVTRAYRALLHSKHDDDSQPSSVRLKGTAHWDNELKDHRNLINELFQNTVGVNLAQSVKNQDKALAALGLYAKDAGASNLNEDKELIRNSCFYLSLAASYLHGIGALSPSSDCGEFWTQVKHETVTNDNNNTSQSEELSLDEALIGKTALDLKRTIEAAVVHAHPEWAAEGKVGEEVQAFSDFLVYVLDSPTTLADWAVAIFDTNSGFVDIYKGKDYPENNTTQNTNLDEWARSNTLTLRYALGHYQPLIPKHGNPRPALNHLLAALDKAGVLYVITDGS